MHPPHINFVKYINESHRQIGINNSTISIFDNIGYNLKYVDGTSNTSTYILGENMLFQNKLSA